MENQVNQMVICPKCKTEVQPESYFCPNCGKALKLKKISTSAVNQMAAYAVSLLLPPLGLYYTYKYFKLGTDGGKIIASVTVVLTVLSLFFSWWFLKNISIALHQYQNEFQSLGI